MKKTKNEIVKIEEETTNSEALKEEIRRDLKSYIDESVKRETDSYIKLYNAQVLKPKKRKILKLRIIIFLLIILYIATLAFLVKDHYFDKYIIKLEETFVKKENKEKKEEPKKEEEPKVDPEKEEEERKQREAKQKEEEQNRLREKYNDIFSSVIVKTTNGYLHDLYGNTFSNKLFLSLGVELLDLPDISHDDGVITLNGDKLLEKVKLVTDKNIVNESFVYNNINFKYIKSLNIYMLDKEFDKDGTFIERRILNIEEKGNTVTIDTIDYYTKNGKYFNPLTNEEIANFGEIDSGTMFKTYVFTKSNNYYYLDK